MSGTKRAGAWPAGPAEVQLAGLRLGCLKLASDFRTPMTTPEDTKALADKFLAYCMGGESKNPG